MFILVETEENIGDKGLDHPVIVTMLVGLFACDLRIYDSCC